MARETEQRTLMKGTRREVIQVEPEVWRKLDDYYGKKNSKGRISSKDALALLDKKPSHMTKVDWLRIKADEAERLKAEEEAEEAQKAESITPQQKWERIAERFYKRSIFCLGEREMQAALTSLFGDDEHAKEDFLRRCAETAEAVKRRQEEEFQRMMDDFLDPTPEPGKIQQLSKEIKDILCAIH